MSVKYVSSLDSLPIMLIIADTKQDKILYFNTEATNIVGNINVGDSFSQTIEISAEFEAFIAKAARGAYKYSAGHRVNGHWIMINAGFDDETPENIMLTGTDITNLVLEGYFEPGKTKDETLGIYDKQSGMNLLNNYATGLMEDEKPKFTICYLQLDCSNIKDGNQVKPFMKDFVNVVMSGIRGTDIFAYMGDRDFLIIFPKCTFEVVEHIMTTIENKLEIINATEELHCKFLMEYAILEVSKDKVADAEAILTRVKNLL